MVCAKRPLHEADGLPDSTPANKRPCDLVVGLHWSSSCDDDLLSGPARDLGHLRSLQRLNPVHDSDLKYVQYRGLLVSFVIDVCEDFKLLNITMHRSLNYLDRLLSKHTQISRQCYQLVATACILVSAKFEEQPQNVPTLTELGRLCATSAGQDMKQQLVAAEKILLETLEWNAHSATHLHFSHSYMGKGVLYPTDTIEGMPVRYSDKVVVARCMEIVAKLCLEDYSFLKFEPSLAAAAGVAVSRSFCRINPTWPSQLADMSGYSFKDISECYASIQKLFANNFPESDDLFADCAESQRSPKCVTQLTFGPPQSERKKEDPLDSEPLSVSVVT